MTKDIEEIGGDALRELRTKVLEQWGIDGRPSSPTAGGFPVAAAPSLAEETGVILPTRQGAGVERGTDLCVTAGETAPKPAICSAEKRRFSPDMELRWLPTIDGKVVMRPTIPFSGYNTRSEAVEAARKCSHRIRER